MTNRTGDFIWYELMTTDHAASRAFYGSVVGWTIADNPDPDAGGVDYRMIRRTDGGMAGGVLTLSAAMCEGGARPCWIGYIHVPDVDATARAAEQAGGAVLMPPSIMEQVGRMAMVADPQGAPFYIFDPLPPPDDPDATSDAFSVDQPQHIRWNELNAADLDPALAFYCGLFGWQVDGEMDMGPLGPYRFLRNGEVMIGAGMRMVPEQPQPAWIFYIGVDDIDRAFAAAVTGGATVLAEPMEIPGGEFSTTCIDPQGAVFGLVGPRKGS